MNRMSNLLTLGVAAVVVLGFSTQVFALCPVSQPAENLSGGKILNCPDAKPVVGFVGVVGATAANNSAGIDVVCEDGSVTSGQQIPCQGEAGAPGDNIVTVNFDWGNLPAATGCPNPSGLPNVGRNIFSIVCNNGAGALFTVAYDNGFTGYPVEYASPFVDGATFDITVGTDQNGLKLETFNRAGGTDTACINQTTQLPHLYSDCDATSNAAAFGIPCLDGTPTLAAGANLFTFTGPASPGPQDLRTTAWLTASSTAGPNNSKCVNYPTPAAGVCTWIGSTSVVGGSDIGAITGWVQVCAGDPTAATDKVKINAAAFNQGKLSVAFSTENEALIVGFNVYAGSTKLNTGLIAAKGTGSNAYSFEVGRGAVKSNRTVTVEAVKSDGSVVKTDPANVK